MISKFVGFTSFKSSAHLKMLKKEEKNMFKKFIYLLMLFIVFNSTSPAMRDVNDEQRSGLRKHAGAARSHYSDETLEEPLSGQTSKKEYFMFGFAFCALGVSASSIATMALGGFLCSQGLYRHVTDHFD
jgi:hypothetical protein